MSEKFFDKRVPARKERENGTIDADIVLGSRDASKRFDAKNFQGIYSQESLQRDVEIVEALKRRFAEDLEHLDEVQLKKVREGKLRSEALEAIIVDFGDILEWFGAKAKLTQTAEFDDLVHGVDGIIEFDLSDKQPYRMALVIDASMKPVFDSLERKVSRNIEKIVGNEKQAEVKYFASKVDGFKGKLSLVVPTVIGVEGDNANQLIKLFSEIIQLKNKPRQDYMDEDALDQKMREAKNHPAQIVFLREIKEQLSLYVYLIEAEMKKRHMTDREKDVKNLYKKEIIRFSGIIDDLLSQKKTIAEGALKNDGVYATIHKVVDEKMK